jgi:CRP-like cAMP-binding protein
VRKVLLLGGLRHYNSGAFVARRGEIGGGLYLVVRGRLKLDATIDEAEIAAGELEEGAVFGELADGTSTWSADVIAEESSELLLLDEASLDRLRRRFPLTAGKLFRNLAVMLSRRLRAFEALTRDGGAAGRP